VISSPLLPEILDFQVPIIAKEHPMFLVHENPDDRDQRIRDFLASDLDAAIAVILSAVQFEWTVRRAIIALGSSPNKKLREQLSQCYGLDKYKNMWKLEVHPKHHTRLTQIVENWQDLRDAFNLRDRLLHGLTSCDRSYATRRVEAAIRAACFIRQFAQSKGVDLHKRLPIRRRVNTIF